MLFDLDFRRLCALLLGVDLVRILSLVDSVREVLGVQVRASYKPEVVRYFVPAQLFLLKGVGQESNVELLNEVSLGVLELVELQHQALCSLN